MALDLGCRKLLSLSCVVCLYLIACEPRISLLTNQCRSYQLNEKKKEQLCFIALFGSTWWHRYSPHLWKRIYFLISWRGKGRFYDHYLRTWCACLRGRRWIVGCSSLKTWYILVYHTILVNKLKLANHSHSIFSEPAKIKLLMRVICYELIDLTFLDSYGFTNFFLSQPFSRTHKDGGDFLFLERESLDLIYLWDDINKSEETPFI